MTIGTDYFMGVLSGMLIMAGLVWGVRFFIDLSPFARRRKSGGKDSALLTTEDVESFTTKLTYLMDEQQLFLKPDLTRDELSRQMGMSHTNFTTLLRQTTQLSFYEYINGLRVRYAAQLIESGKTDITTISTRSGFKYRSTFYRTFASVYHCTPAEYINKKSTCSLPIRSA